MGLVVFRYRLREEKAEWIIYLTDVGQQTHFDMVFSVWITDMFPSDEILAWRILSSVF